MTSSSSRSEVQDDCASSMEGDTLGMIAARALTYDTNPIRIASMVDVRDVCRLGLLCRMTRESYGRRARKACLTKGAGVPEERRVQFWQFMLNVKKEMAERAAGAQERRASDMYKSCLHGKARRWTNDGDDEVIRFQHTKSESNYGDSTVSPSSGRRALSSTGAEGEISRDVGRTFPQQKMFSEPNAPGQNMLANVLRACLNANPDVGYCQGMNFVAGALLLACSVRDPSINLPPPNPVQNRWSSHGEINGVNSGSLGRGSDARSPSADSHVMSVTTESSYCSDEDEEVVVVLRGEGQDEEVGTEADGVGDTEPEDETPKEWRSGPQHQKAEEDVFWLMLALSTRLSGVGAGLGMRELWLPGVPQLKVRVFQFDKLLLRELPRLYNHFKAKQLQLERAWDGFHSWGESLTNHQAFHELVGGSRTGKFLLIFQVLVSQWFLTLFSYSLRPPLLLRVLDLTFTDGWKAMFRFGLARLRSVEDTLCGLEIEGVSRFLRGYREGDAPPSPPPMSCGQTSREATFRDGARASGTGGSGRRWSSSRHITAPAIARSSSAQVLRAAWKIKVTRKTLECLQQDFAVQLLKEHLEGEGQWLTRYGDAPEPTPGAGAGVVGGGADGDVGFMGVEAMTRMMLSDSKLLARLKRELDGISAPLQADAQVFQNKITEASERQEEATRERSSLAAELVRVKEDVDALGQRKKIITEQMHQLLVKFENDSHRMEGEEARSRRYSQRATDAVTAGREGNDDSAPAVTTGTGILEENPRHGIITVEENRSAGSENCRGTRQKENGGGQDGRGKTADGGGDGVARDERGVVSSWAVRGASTLPSMSGGPGGKLDSAKRLSVPKSGHGDLIRSWNTPPRSMTSSKPELAGATAVVSAGIMRRATATPPRPTSPPSSGRDGMLRTWKSIEPVTPEEPPARERTGSAVLRSRFSVMSSLLQVPSILPQDPGEDEDGGHDSFVYLSRGRRIGNGTVREGRSSLDGAGSRGTRRTTHMASHGSEESGSDARENGLPSEQLETEGTWGKLTKWARPTSGWFTGGALGASRALGGSLSPTRRNRRGKQQPLSRLEELYEDLREFRRRLEEVQSGIDEKTEMYASLHHSYVRAMVEAEEAMELKRALSSQMLQLLLEQEKRMEGHLRDCITFAGGANAEGLSSDYKSHATGLGLHRRGRDDRFEGKREMMEAHRVTDSVGDGLGNGSRPHLSTTPMEGSSVSEIDVPKVIVINCGEEAVDQLLPETGQVQGLQENGEPDDDDGFEKVESWMARGPAEHRARNDIGDSGTG